MDGKGKWSSPVLAVVIAVLLGGLPLYLLSTGPAVWICDHYAIPRERLVTAYAPIVWLDENVPFFSTALSKYISLWESPATPSPPATSS